MDLIGRQLIELVAKSTKMNIKMVELLDEKAVSRIDSMINSMFVDRHLSSDVYFRHLTRVVATIGEHGWSIIVGRGAHLILPKEKTIRLRFIAPKESRIGYFIRTRRMTHAEAQKYVEKKDADRSGFIRKYFKADADDPTNFDLVVNTGEMGIETAYTVVAAVIRKRIQAEEKAKPGARLQIVKWHPRVKCTERIRRSVRTLCCFPHEGITPNLKKVSMFWRNADEKRHTGSL